MRQTAILALLCIALCNAQSFVKMQGIPEGLSATYVQFLDYDNDGRPDMLLNGSRLFHNGGKAPGDVTLNECGEAAGIKDGGYSLCYDYDCDGLVDIVTAFPHVWHNNGDGTFTDMAEKLSFAPGPKVMSMAAGDLDGDGLPDLFIGASEDWNSGNPVYYKAQLWMNRGDHWEECSEAVGTDTKTYARGILINDIDGDGRQDVFVTNYRLQANILWINSGDGKFQNKAAEYGVAGELSPKKFYDATKKQHYGPHYGHGIGACWMDFDRDGMLDLLVANLVHKYVGPTSKGGYDIRGYVCGDSTFYRFDGKAFKDVRKNLGVPLRPIGGRGEFKGDELWSGCMPADVDCDGFEDVFIPQIYNLNYARAILFMNQDGKSFKDCAPAAGIGVIDSYAGAWADLDGDGYMDLVTSGRPQVDAPREMSIYLNQGGGNSWYKIRLLSKNGRTAIGAKVTVKLGDARLVRLNSAGIGTMSQQNSPYLHFGLGATPPEEFDVTVKWPDGTATELKAKPNTTAVLSVP